MDVTTASTIEILPQLLNRVNSDKVKQQIAQVSFAHGSLLTATSTAQRTAALGKLHEKISELPARYHRVLRELPLGDKSLLVPWGTPPTIDELYADFVKVSAVAALLMEYAEKALGKSGEKKPTKAKSISNKIQNKIYPVVGKFIAELIIHKVKPEFIVLSLLFIVETFLTPEFLKEEKFDTSALIGALIRALSKLLFTKEEKEECGSAVKKTVLKSKNNAFDHEQRELFLGILHKVFKAEIDVKKPLPECKDILEDLFNVVMNQKIDDVRRVPLVNALRDYLRWQTQHTPSAESTFFTSMKLCHADDQASFRRFCVETPVVAQELKRTSTASPVVAPPPKQEVFKPASGLDLLFFDAAPPNSNFATALAPTPVAAPFVVNFGAFQGHAALAEKTSPKEDESKKDAKIDADGDELDISTEENSQETSAKPAPEPAPTAQPVEKATTIDKDAAAEDPEIQLKVMTLLLKREKEALIAERQSQQYSSHESNESYDEGEADESSCSRSPSPSGRK